MCIFSEGFRDIFSANLQKLQTAGEHSFLETVSGCGYVDTGLNLFSVVAGLQANGPTPMKDGLLMALQEIGKNGKIFSPRLSSVQGNTPYNGLVCTVEV